MRLQITSRGASLMDLPYFAKDERLMAAPMPMISKGGKCNRRASCRNSIVGRKASQHGLEGADKENKYISSDTSLSWWTGARSTEVIACRKIPTP